MKDSGCYLNNGEIDFKEIGSFQVVWVVNTWDEFAKWICLNTLEFQMSNEISWGLGYIGDEILPSYVGIMS